MADTQNLPKNEQVQHVPNQRPPPQYMTANTTHVISVPQQAPIFRTPQDEAYISSIRCKAITSLILSIVASLCVWPILCTVPAIILSILALVETTNLGTADSYAKAAVVLTTVSVAVGGILLVLSIVYIVNDDEEYQSSYGHSRT